MNNVQQNRAETISQNSITYKGDYLVTIVQLPCGGTTTVIQEVDDLVLFLED